MTASPPRRRVHRVFVPAEWHPFVRLAVVVVVVLVGDRATELITRGGGSIDPLVVTLVRLVLSLPVLHFPLAGSVVALEADKWDWFWLRMGEQDEARQAIYQDWDKLLDLVYLGLAAIVVTRWPDRRARRVALAAFAVRTAGVALYFATGVAWLLVTFPNVFESFFLLYVSYSVFTRRERMLTSGREAFWVFLAVLVPKVAQEYFLHIMEDRPWNMFHVPSLFIPEPWVWGALQYGPPVLALGYLIMTTHARQQSGDPEEELSVV